MEQVTGESPKSPRRRGASWRAGPLLFASFLFLLGHAPLPAQPAEPLDYQVKAVFLLNFTKFIEWPDAAFDGPNAPISICILGPDPFGAALDQILADEVVGGRKVIAVRLKRDPAPGTCQVLYMGEARKGAARASGPNLLTVGEGADFPRSGGMIGFVLENRRVRFDINRTAVESAGLKISSKLLSVAQFVEK